MGRLTGIFLFPVKSLRGCAVDEASVDGLGLAGDRRFLVVDEGGRFLTQRALPRMALITAELRGGVLTLSADGAGSATACAGEGGPQPAARTISIWKDEGLRAEDCGAEAAGWLSAFLGVKCRLVRIGREFSRPIPAAKLPGEWGGRPPRVGFADAYPFLVVGEASLADLNGRIAARGEEPVPMSRFRPNLVIGGCEAFAEDRGKRMRIGSLVLRAAGPCRRCAITTIDPATAERGLEPLRTLATYRREAGRDGSILFGQNMIHEAEAARIAVGDPVEVLDEEGTIGGNTLQRTESTKPTQTVA